jgi:hypothetical protein
VDRSELLFLGQHLQDKGRRRQCEYQAENDSDIAAETEYPGHAGYGYCAQEHLQGAQPEDHLAHDPET